MKFLIVRDLPGRLRLRTPSRFSREFGFGLEDRLRRTKEITNVVTNEITGSLCIDYVPGTRDKIWEALAACEKNPITPVVDESRSQEIELKRKFENKLIKLFVGRYVIRPLLPYPVRKAVLFLKAIPFIQQGLDSLLSTNLNVEVLDATAISISLLRRNYSTAGSTIFLLQLSDLLEEWTTNRTKLDLTKTLELNIDKVLLVEEEETRWIPAHDIEIGDRLAISQGSIIPVDGTVVEGLGTVDESKMTGESEPSVKKEGSIVFAGTVLGEGSLEIIVDKKLEHSRMNEIIEAIESASAGKSVLEYRSEELADRIVPFSFLTALAVYGITRNITKTISVLLVDYSCAIKLSTPLAVIAALRQGAKAEVLIKGGRYLEEVSKADSFVFDKTGTLTTSEPIVKKVIAFEPYERDEFLRTAACIEEHFPHSMGRAIVQAAKDEGLSHAERHAEVEYIVAHGITTRLEGKRILIGSYHYIFEDNEASCTEEQWDLIEKNSEKYSIIYMSVDHKAAGFICLQDPPRPEAKKMIQELRDLDVKNIYMLTGDGERAAKGMAEVLGIDDYRSGVLPDEKASFLRDLKNKGHKIAMIGDGINDSPALALADVSISMKDSSDLAKDVADVVIQNDSLEKLPEIRKLGLAMEERIHKNYQTIIGFNTALLVLGVTGLASPTFTATAHNLSTLLIGINGARDYKNVMK
ncbi:MAG: heavy metal translocating P-type ATPase [Tissierellia bacterium]|nr:heavy metal translocating P-type ATPase [Tissierellia bacterium]